MTPAHGLAEEQPALLINGVRVGVRDHFTQQEWEQIVPGLWGEVRKLTLVPLDRCADPAFLAEHRRSGIRGRYLNCLAFYHRTRFPLAHALVGKYKRFRYPYELLPNMHAVYALIDAHYPALFLMDRTNQRRRAIVTEMVSRISFSLWLAGYGILPGLGWEPVDQEVLAHALAIAPSKSLKNHIRLLARFLANEPRSPVMVPFVQNSRTSVVDLERGHWHSVRQQYGESDLLDALSEYVFGEFLDRTRHAIIRTSELVVREQSEQVRVSKGQITLSTWHMGALALRKFGTYCLAHGASSVANMLREEATGDCLLDRYLVEVIHTKAASQQYGFRSHTQTWLEWCRQTQGIPLNVKRYFPQHGGRRTQAFGKILHLGALHQLVLTLLDPQTPFINENDLLQYRCRRAALIQLATGARIESVCLLRHDCLTTYDGRLWLRFHKTKGGREHLVEVQSDVAQWIREALQVSAQRDIPARPGQDPVADGLLCRRVFANSRNDGPLTFQHVNSFLAKLQASLWPETHPNGRLFTTHDFRRAKATEMLIEGKALDEIKDQLGQQDINALIPYLATGAPQFQAWFLAIFREGIWKNVTPVAETPDPMAVDTVLAQSMKQTTVTMTETFIQGLIRKAMDDVGAENARTTPGGVSLPVIQRGFPRMTHTCTAQDNVNCGWTELECFSCRDYYRPDPTTLAAHVIELFRWMVRALLGEQRERQQMKKQHAGAYLAPAPIREKLEQALRMLLREKFQLAGDVATRIESRLWVAAKAYCRIKENALAVPTYQEAETYLRSLDEDQTPLLTAEKHG